MLTVVILQKSVSSSEIVHLTVSVSSEAAAAPTFPIQQQGIVETVRVGRCGLVPSPGCTVGSSSNTRMLYSCMFMLLQPLLEQVS